MQIAVLIEPVPGAGYVARAGSPFNWTAEGATPDEAVDRLRAETTSRLAAGARMTTIDVANPADPLAALRASGAVIEPLPPGENPWLRMAGMWKDDPTFDKFQKAVQEYRESIDNDTNIP